MIKKNDIFIISAVLVLALALFIVNIITNKSGEYVKISVDGKEYAVCELKKNNSFVIKRDNYYNIIEIKDNCVYMSEANCHDHTCVKQGKISKTNQMIVCLPNKVVIEIIGKTNGNTDAVVS